MRWASSGVRLSQVNLSPGHCSTRQTVHMLSLCVHASCIATGPIVATAVTFARSMYVMALLVGSMETTCQDSMPVHLVAVVARATAIASAHDSRSIATVQVCCTCKKRSSHVSARMRCLRQQHWWCSRAVQRTCSLCANILGIRGCTKSQVCNGAEHPVAPPNLQMEHALRSSRTVTGRRVSGIVHATSGAHTVARTCKPVRT